MKRNFFTLFSALSLLACFATRVECQRGLRGVRYVRSLAVPDKKLARAIIGAIPDFTARNISLPEARDSETWIRYLYNRVDLNGDGHPETIVWVYGKRISAATGFEALIFRSDKRGYKLIGRLADVWTPVIVSRRTTHGWKDLFVWVAGGGTLGHYVRVSFGRESYSEPDGIFYSSTVADQTRIRGTAFVLDDYSSGFKGIVLKKRR
jgi:hypothetical protein